MAMIRFDDRTRLAIYYVTQPFGVPAAIIDC